VAEQITLTLPDDLAQRVREVATSTQRNLEEVLLEWLDRSSIQLSSQTPTENTEAKLLQQINLGFPADWWNRYRSLIANRQAETISETDLAQLIEMSEALEIANVKRVAALGELAQLRDCSIEQVMEALGIGTRSDV
jgi:hypothetical protein